MGKFDDVDNKDLQIIKTIGEDGEEVNLKLLDIVSVNSLDYALLLPEGADFENDEECEVILMRLKQDNSEYVFEAIDDDDEFKIVSEAILSDEDDDDDECDE